MASSISSMVLRFAVLWLVLAVMVAVEGLICLDPKLHGKMVKLRLRFFLGAHPQRCQHGCCHLAAVSIGRSSGCSTSWC